MTEKKKNVLITILSIFIILSSFIIATSVLYTYVLKPQTIYNEANELYDSGNYEEAILEFEKIDDFKGAKQKVNDCKEKLK